MTNRVNSWQSLVQSISYKSLPDSPDYKRGMTIRKRDYILSRGIVNFEAVEKLATIKKKLRGVVFWSSILKQIRLYGVSANFTYIESMHKSYAEVLKYEQMSNQPGRFISQQYFLFHPHSKGIQVWSLVMLILLLYVFIGTPWIIAFERVQVGSGLFYIELTVDFLFFCDILVTLNTAYVLKDELVTKRSAIFCNYLKGLLLIDILAIFPFYLFEGKEDGRKSNSLVRIIRITKVARVFRASKVFKLIQHVANAEWLDNIFKMIKSHEGIARLFAVGFLMLIMAHITACMWFFTARLDDFGPNTWVVRNGLANQTKGHLYLVSLYWAFTILTTVGLGDIHAVTQIEMLLCIFWLIFGIGFYTFLIGTLTSVLSNMDIKRMAVRKKMEEIEIFGAEYSVPKYLVKSVKKEVNQQKDLEKMDQETRVEILNMLSNDLRHQVCLSMHNSAVQKIQFLKNQEILFINEVVPRLEYEAFPSDFLLYERNDHPDKIFFVVKGRAIYLLGKNNIKFRTIVPGGYFGEIELFLDLLRRFSVATQVESHFLTMNKKLFKFVSTNYPRVTNEMKENAIAKMEIENDAMNNVISVVEDTHKINLPRDFTGSTLNSELKRSTSTTFIRSISSSVVQLQRNTSNMTSKSSIKKSNNDTIFKIQSKMKELQKLAERVLK